MSGSVPGVYDSSYVTTLLDPKFKADGVSTAEGILAAMRDIAKRATPDDIVLIFFAGHGRAIDGKYYFAPLDMGQHDPDQLKRIHDAYGDKSVSDAEYDRKVDVLFRTEGLSQDQLLEVMKTIQATHVALVLDTCYSATLADLDTVLRQDVNVSVTDRIAQSSGRFVLSGSFSRAYDASDDSDVPTGADGHGLFTSFLLRALRGEARTGVTGHVDVGAMAKYTQTLVKQESRGRKQGIQVPEYYFVGNDFFDLR
jgi:uncharacterized caspase-like protein